MTRYTQDAQTSNWTALLPLLVSSRSTPIAAFSFQKYPHFQLDDLTQQEKKELSNNATSFRTPNSDEGKGRGSEKEATQEKDVAEVVTDPDLTRERETPVLDPVHKGKNFKNRETFFFETNLNAKLRRNSQTNRIGRRRL